LTPERQALRHLVVDDPEALGPYIADWDALSVNLDQPFCAPAWMLAWWRHGTHGDSRLRVVLVFDGDELVGVGPFFAQVAPVGLVEMRLLAAGFCHRIGPLAKEGYQLPVAAVLAAALAAMRPRPASVVFEGIDLSESWPTLVAEAWPARSRPRLRTDLVMPGSVIRIGESYDDWLARRARHFRKEARRTARRLEEAGVRSRISEDAGSVDALFSLNRARWSGRGGSSLGAQAHDVVADAAQGLAGTGRLAVVLLESSEGPLAAELVLSAGQVAGFWGGGFDPAWSHHAPGTQAILAALQTLAAQGVEVADLGGGHAEYQRRLADGTQPVAWQTLFPRGIRYPLIRVWLAPKHVFVALRRVADRLPRRQRELLGRLAHPLRR
jgi:CelD/BcsL family acetyltransferase involved in cellulose biosynthesis